MVTTSGHPEGRSKSFIPKHLKYYSMASIKSPINQISQEQFAKQHPNQYKALNLYSYVSKKNNRKPLSKIKNVVGINKPIDYISDTMQTRASYTFQDNEQGPFHESLVLPKIITKQKKYKYITGDKTFKPIYQAQSIAHEDTHSHQSKQQIIKDESLSQKYRARNTVYSQKKYGQLPTESQAEKGKSQFNKSLDKQLDNPSSKEQIRSILHIKKGYKFNPKK